MWHILLEATSGYMNEVTGNSQHGCTEGKSYLIAFSEKITGFVDEERAVGVNNLT